MRVIHLAVVLAMLCSGAYAQDPPKPPPPAPPFGEEPPPRGQDSQERREQIDRLESEIRDLEVALKQEKLEDRRDELKKRLSQKYAQLKELKAGGRMKDPKPEELGDRMRRLEMRIQELERALQNKEMGPEDRKELNSQLHHARAQMDELRGQMKGDPLHRRDVAGKVTAWAEDVSMVVLSIGRDHGVNEGDEFTVHRESVFIAKVVIDRVDRAWSSGRVMMKGKEGPRVGDVASRNMLGRPFQDHRGGPPPDPELHKLHMAAQELEQSASGIGAKLRKTPPDDKKAREELKGMLIETVTKLFDLREKARAREIETIRKRLEELTQMLDKRKVNRDAIIEKRVKQLSGESDDLDW